MSSINYETYVALKAAGVSEDMATQAAASIDEIAQHRHPINTKLAELDGKILYLQIAISAIGVGVGALIVKAFLGG